MYSIRRPNVDVNCIGINDCKYLLKEVFCIEDVKMMSFKFKKAMGNLSSRGFGIPTAVRKK